MQIHIFTAEYLSERIVTDCCSGLHSAQFKLLTVRTSELHRSVSAAPVFNPQRPRVGGAPNYSVTPDVNQNHSSQNYNSKLNTFGQMMVHNMTCKHVCVFPAGTRSLLLRLLQCPDTGTSTLQRTFVCCYSATSRASKQPLSDLVTTLMDVLPLR